MYVYMYSCICACRVRDAQLYGQPTYTRTRKKYIFHSALILRTKERKKKKDHKRSSSLRRYVIGNSKCRPCSSAILIDFLINSFFTCVKILNVFLDLYLLLFLSLSLCLSLSIVNLYIYFFHKASERRVGFYV